MKMPKDRAGLRARARRLVRNFGWVALTLVLIMAAAVVPALLLRYGLRAGLVVWGGVRARPFRALVGGSQAQAPLSPAA